VCLRLLLPPPGAPLFPYTPLFRSLLPPVSGGAATLTDSFQPAAVVPGVVALVLVLVNLRGDAAMWAAGLVAAAGVWAIDIAQRIDRKSTRLNSSHVKISYAVFCLK